MITAMGDRAWDRKSKQVIEVPGGAAGLEPGLARGRYDELGRVHGRNMFRACEQDLILRGLNPTAKQHQIRDGRR
ncbi:hypothetical protein [Streptomyces sp. 8L]|uniref:hypothetical protein n=1 Tax=Streptomyces sp. 8L TaxID=2877242 RepID=UPI001CD39D42|nr:hypothetical protein [Streptomyces sp. 8L]MCA1221400.1 hypothetical protein [Streptomyces sp. 8L]